MNREVGRAVSARHGQRLTRRAGDCPPHQRSSSWSQCMRKIERRLSMNRTDSGGFGLEQHIVFAGEFVEETLFGLRDFFFVLFESLLDVRPAVNHQAPEQLGQFASQGQIGDQTTTPPLESPVKAAQGFIDGASDTSGDHAEQSSSPVAATLLAASAFTTLTAPGCQTQPTREVLFRLPVIAQISPDLRQQL